VSGPTRQWRLEADSLKTLMMLLAHHATGEREAGLAALHTLITSGDIDQVAYALAGGFAELAQPRRDRDRPFVNLPTDGPAADRNDYSITANSLIAAAANMHRTEAFLLLERIPLEEKIRLVSLLLDLVVFGIRRWPPPPELRRRPPGYKA